MPVMLSIALSYAEGDGIVRPDRTMMGVGDKMVWLPSPLWTPRALARLQDTRFPKQESEIAEPHPRSTSVTSVVYPLAYVQVCEKVCSK